MTAMIRPLALVLAFVVGWFFPQGAVMTWIIPFFVAFMLFMTFLGLNVHKISLRRSHLIIVALNILSAVGAYELVGLFTERGSQLALLAFFTALAPTATAAPAIATFLKREMEYVVTGLLLTTFAVSIALPTLLPWAMQKSAAGGEFLAAFLQVAKSVALTMVLPIIAARIWRKVYPESKNWTKRYKNVTFGAWILMVTIIACRASEFIRNPENAVTSGVLIHAGALSLAICVFNFVAGYFVGEKDRREEASQTLGQKNTGAMIVFATLYADPIVALGPTIYVLWHNLWNAAQLAYMAEKDVVHAMHEANEAKEAAALAGGEFTE